MLQMWQSNTSETLFGRCVRSTIEIVWGSPTLFSSWMNEPVGTVMYSGDQRKVLWISASRSKVSTPSARMMFPDGTVAKAIPVVTATTAATADRIAIFRFTASSPRDPMG